jgi:hypothetical protein
MSGDWRESSAGREAHAQAMAMFNEIFGQNKVPTEADPVEKRVERIEFETRNRAKQGYACAVLDTEPVLAIIADWRDKDAELRRLRERLESIEGVATALLGAMRKVNVTEGLDEIERLQGIEKAAMWVLHEHPQPSWPAMNDLRAALGEAAE